MILSQHHENYQHQKPWPWLYPHSHKPRGTTLAHKRAISKRKLKVSRSLSIPNCSCLCGLHAGCPLITLDAASERKGKKIKGWEQRRSFSSCFNPIFILTIAPKSWKDLLGHPKSIACQSRNALCSIFFRAFISLYFNDSSNGDSTISQTLLFGKTHRQLTFPSAHFHAIPTHCASFYQHNFPCASKAASPSLPWGHVPSGQGGVRGKVYSCEMQL